MDLRYASALMWVRVAVALLPWALSAFACHRSSELVLRDTEGRTFAAQCETSGACKLTRKSGAPASTQKGELVLHAPGRVVGMCEVAAREDPSPSDCRALVCEKDDDCPPSHGLSHGHCLSGVCVEPANALSVPDAVMLCLAGTGLGRRSPQQVERYALAQNCGNPCVVPQPCRQL